MWAIEIFSHLYLVQSRITKESNGLNLFLGDLMGFGERKVKVIPPLIILFLHPMIKTVSKWHIGAGTELHEGGLSFTKYISVIMVISLMTGRPICSVGHKQSHKTSTSDKVTLRSLKPDYRATQNHVSLSLSTKMSDCWFFIKYQYSFIFMLIFIPCR